MSPKLLSGNPLVFNMLFLARQVHYLRPDEVAQ